MKLGYCFLNNVKDVNSYENASELELISGNATKLYFQIVDADVPLSEDCDLFLRYLPAAGATVTAVFDHIADSKKIERTATQPFAEDRSIWVVDILATDQIALNSLEVTLTEGSNVTQVIRLCELRVRGTGDDQYFC